MPYAECAVYIEIDEVYYHITEYGIVIQAYAVVRVYFTFGNLFETFIRSQNFSPTATVFPLYMFHDGIDFPPLSQFSTNSTP